MRPGRPRQEIRLDPDVKARLDTILISPLAGGKPFGAVSAWCGDAIAFRTTAVEVNTPQGRIWCDAAVWEYLTREVPAYGKLALTGSDPSSGF
jgi:hypothetical protein